MTPRKPCPTIPGPLEDYAGQFDDLFGHRAQRQRFREYLQGLLLPRDRNKTLTALVGNWLRVLGTAERSQVDQRIRQQLHPIVQLLDAFKT
jgi:hypothetical protein